MDDYLVPDNANVNTRPKNLDSQIQYFAVETLCKLQAFFEGNQYCDVTIAVEDGNPIMAHKVVLCAASDYFAAMFGSDMVESTDNLVRLHNMDFSCVKLLISYAYSGDIDISEDNVQSLLLHSEILQFKQVSKLCSEFLTCTLVPQNCLGITEFALNNNCLQLSCAANAFVLANFPIVVKQDEFVDMSLDFFIQLICSDDLNVPNEEFVFNTFMIWLKHDLEARKAHVFEVLRHVRLPLLNVQFLSDKVQDDETIGADADCRGIIMEALRYHLMPERRPWILGTRVIPRKSTMGFLLAVGGIDAQRCHHNTIEKYDPRIDNWHCITTLPTKRVQYGVGIIDRLVYLVGGREGLKTLYTIEIYDVDRNRWTAGPNMETHRHGLAVVVIEGALYAIGGHDGWSYLNTVERYDHEMKVWSCVPSMKSARSACGAACVQSRLYVVGGRDGSSCLKAVEMYDPHTNRWQQCAPMQKRRGGAGVEVYQDFIFVAGGHDAPASHQGQQLLDSVEKFDVKSDVWVSVACMGIQRDAVGFGVLGAHIFAVGGFDGTSQLNSVECYDPQTDTWKDVAPLKTARVNTRVIILPNQPLSETHDKLSLEPLAI